jgi:hypothetical protein
MSPPMVNVPDAFADGVMSPPLAENIVCSSCGTRRRRTIPRYSRGMRSFATLALLCSTSLALADENDPEIASANAIAKVTDRNSKACARKVDGVSGVVMIGWFASDRGCVNGGYVYKKKHVENVRQSGAPLTATGWKNKAKREALALAWATAMDPRGLQNGGAQLQPDGTVQVFGTRSGYVGMRGKEADQPVALSFDNDGNNGPAK